VCAVVDGHAALGVNRAHPAVAIEICAGATLVSRSLFLTASIEVVGVSLRREPWKSGLPDVLHPCSL